MKNDFLDEDFKGKHKQKTLDLNIKESVQKHELFLTIESHYLRKQTTKAYVSDNNLPFLFSSTTAKCYTTM